jgi:hypothetical protein
VRLLSKQKEESLSFLLFIIAVRNEKEGYEKQRKRNQKESLDAFVSLKEKSKEYRSQDEKDSADIFPYPGDQEYEYENHDRDIANQQPFHFLSGRAAHAEDIERKKQEKSDKNYGYCSRKPIKHFV